ncbi:MAG TPA: FHA domain-containing protein, partial [Verrucomicrobiae bacterium]
MPALSFTAADGQRYEFPLNAGITRIGRIDGNDILVPDDSVAEAHCEVQVENGQVYVRDLNSLTGTAINGSPVSEGPLLPGESLRLGNIEFFLQDGALAPAAYTEPPPEPQLVPGEACRYHPTVAAKWRCTKCGELNCDACTVDGRGLGVPGVKFCRSCKSASAKIGVRRPAGDGKGPAGKSFAGVMTAAWAYPFKGNGPVILIAGAIFFAIAGFAQRFMFLLGGMVYVFTTGYYMAYSQQVVQTSAQDEDQPPSWPDVSEFISDIIVPFFQSLALQVLYLGPVLYCVFHAALGRKEYILFAIVFGAIAVFMMPMGWLAVSMHESVVGISPHVIVPSILRIPGHYLIFFFQLMV